MKSGMLAAEAIMQDDLDSLDDRVKASWIHKELYLARNIRPAFRFGILSGMIYAGLDIYVLRGRAPWTFRNHADHTQLKPASQFKEERYPEPDGKLTFDLMSSVYISNTNHTEDQPVHLQLKDPSVAIETNYARYQSPETRYCPAGVYEIINSDTDTPSLRINAQNCVHCKTCDIKDPTQNIDWVTPEGGGGPNYPNM